LSLPEGVSPPTLGGDSSVVKRLRVPVDKPVSQEYHVPTTQRSTAARRKLKREDWAMRNMTKLSLALLIVAAVSLVSCSSGALEDVEWVLESYGETGELVSVTGDEEITAEFRSEEGQVGGSAGCNRYFGGYELSGSKLSIPGPLGSTLMACPEDIMDQEMAYLQALQAAESYKIDGDELRIDCGEQVLVFKKK